MYVDTPRDHVDSVYDHLLFGDQPLGWDIIGTKDTIRAAGRQTFLDYLGAWYAPRRMVVGAAGAVDGEFAAEVERQFGHLEDRADRRAGADEVEQDAPRVKLETRDSDQAHLRLGVRGLPTTHRDRYVDAGDVGDPRRRHVVAALHRGARAARPRLLRLLPPPVLRRHRHAVLAGRASTSSASTWPCRRSCGEFGKLAAEPVEEDELRRTKNYLKGRIVLQLEDPRGLLGFGLRREVLEDRLAEPEEVLEGIEAVTAADIQRLAGEVIRDRGAQLRPRRAVRRRPALPRPDARVSGIRLYAIPYSTNVERVALALGHKGVDAEVVMCDAGDRTPIREASGQDLVPVLDDEGFVVVDSSRIIEHLEERFPDPPLFPAEPARAAETRVFVDWFNRVWKVPPNRIEQELAAEAPDHVLVEALEAEMRASLTLFEAMLDGRDYLLGGRVLGRRLRRVPVPQVRPVAARRRRRARSTGSWPSTWRSTAATRGSRSGCGASTSGRAFRAWSSTRRTADRGRQVVGCPPAGGDPAERGQRRGQVARALLDVGERLPARRRGSARRRCPRARPRPRGTGAGPRRGRRARARSSRAACTASPPFPARSPRSGRGPHGPARRRRPAGRREEQSGPARSRAGRARARGRRTRSSTSVARPSSASASARRLRSSRMLPSSMCDRPSRSRCSPHASAATTRRA